VISSLLIANRGEIALRIARTARGMGWRTVMVASDADHDAPHARGGDACVGIGGQRPADSYLRIDRIVDAARSSGAHAVHPGYGFLAENADFAQAVIDAGLVWVGPSPVAMRSLGRKADARRLAVSLGVPVVPGYDGQAQDDSTLIDQAQRIGFPLLVKASAGGGGRGMRLVLDALALPAAIDAARREARAAFGDATLVLERAVQRARHVEIQVFADSLGNVIHLGERDCSVQRRHQKLVEEAPCPVLGPELRRRMGACAVELARAVGYVGAGTVEMLLDVERSAFHFMEMNTRLQVEHPVTEALLGVDLVEWQLRVARGEPLPLSQEAALEAFERGGHAIEVRLCAEDPRAGDLPQAGTMRVWRAPAVHVRVDHALADGAPVAPFYDSMLAKLIVHAPPGGAKPTALAPSSSPRETARAAASPPSPSDTARTDLAPSAFREQARRALAQALDDTVALGVTTNRTLLAAVLRHDDFVRAAVHTTWLDDASSDRATGLPAPTDDDLALLALWIVTRAGAELPAAWAASMLAAPCEQKITLRVNGAAVQVALKPAAEGTVDVRIDGRSARTFKRRAWQHDGAMSTLIAQRYDGTTASIDAAGTRDGQGAWTLHARCGTLDLDVIDDRFAPPVSNAAQLAGEVRAPMHGRLVRLHVAVGDVVQRGQALAVLEAMKMEHVIGAPIAGRVISIGAAQGAQVSPSIVLLVVAED
jgi:geranyl-CoA carboxylase alpha subunit